MQKKEKIVAEYTLQKMDSPMGVASYEINESILQKTTRKLTNSRRARKSIN